MWRPSVRHIVVIPDHRGTHRTDVATLNANGAWYVVDPDTSSTDCVASAIGPSILAATACPPHVISLLIVSKHEPRGTHIQ